MQVSDWKFFVTFDVLCEETGKTFAYREYLFLEDKIMGMNDPCFCGSGKKIKKCHPNIHEKSVIANLYKTFSFIDSEYTIKDHPYCCKGCSLCCSDYFTISLVEFFMILQHLEIISPQEVKGFSDRAKDIASKFDVNQDDYLNIAGYPPCIFIDDTNNSCKIYEVRPTMCRLYGNTNLTKCSKILSDNSMKDRLIAIKDKRVIENIDSFKYKNCDLQPKSHSMVYWFSKLDEKGKLINERMIDLFHTAKSRPIDEFIKIMIL